MSDQDKNKKRLDRQRGQILIEYVLLLMIGLTVGSLMVKSLIAYSDNPEEQGIVIKRWIRIWTAVGKDLPD
jgi:hypothetical protein